MATTDMADGIMKTQGIDGPVEPSAPPPGDPESAYGAPADDDTGTLGSSDWFASSFGLVLCGERMSNEKIKKIVYGGAAAIVLLIIIIIAVVSSGGGAGGGDSGDGKINAVQMLFDTKTTSDASGGKPKILKYVVQWNTQCEAFNNKADGVNCVASNIDGPQTPKGAMDTGGCGITAKGEVFAYHRDPNAWCKDDDNRDRNPECGWKFGPKVTSGVSEVDFGVEGHKMKCSFLSSRAGVSPCKKMDKITVFDVDKNQKCKDADYGR